ncbi:hypothetical protein P5673_008278 [Acropora cervicornis]|uniref:Uncharacterized protein n=1 Tax=Acropora cervicornis TaxID=6130 RepID=A0AAD9QUR3_ACRCE|nr:hypothetical protein P5673_008278 [Acropora cervicornis]
MFIFVLFLLFFDRNQCEMMKQVLEEIITHRVFLNVTYHNSVVILISILVRMLFMENWIPLSCHFIPSTFLKMFCALNKYLFFRVIEEVVA